MMSTKGEGEPKKRVSRTIPEGLDSYDLLRKETLFPTETEERFGVILSAVRSQVQALMLISPLKKEFISSDQLIHTFKEQYEDTEMVTEISRSGIAFDYCVGNLCPNGLVAQEVILQTPTDEIVVGFFLTEAGETFGRRIAAKVIDFQQKNLIIKRQDEAEGTRRKK